MWKGASVAHAKRIIATGWNLTSVVLTCCTVWDVNTWWKAVLSLPWKNSVVAVVLVRRATRGRSSWIRYQGRSLLLFFIYIDVNSRLLMCSMLCFTVPDYIVVQQVSVHCAESIGRCAVEAPLALKILETGRNSTLSSRTRFWAPTAFWGSYLNLKRLLALDEALRSDFFKFFAVIGNNNVSTFQNLYAHQAMNNRKKNWELVIVGKDW